MERKADGFEGEKAIVLPQSILAQCKGNSTCKSLYITHIGFYPKACNHFRERSEGAAQHILLYCIDGEGWVKTAPGGEVILIQKYHYFILPAHKYHCYGSNSENPWSICWLHFTGENSNSFSPTMHKSVYLSDSSSPILSSRLALFDDILKTLEMGYSPDGLEYTTLSLLYLLGSIKYENRFNKTDKQEKEDIIHKSILYMKEHIHEKLTLKELADAMGYSISHFGTLFTERTSFTPMVYFNQLKIQKACDYLQFTKLKIKEIAYELGFYDPFHFSKTFSHEMGITPKAYRIQFSEDYSNNSTRS